MDSGMLHVLHNLETACENSTVKDSMEHILSIFKRDSVTADISWYVTVIS